jgi:hypothetical protein
MPFQSKAQMRAAFGGYLGSEMKGKAKEWADETPNPSALPKHKAKKKGGSPAVEALAKQKFIVR